MLTLINRYDNKVVIRISVLVVAVHLILILCGSWAQSFAPKKLPKSLQIRSIVQAQPSSIKGKPKITSTVTTATAGAKALPAVSSPNAKKTSEAAIKHKVEMPPKASLPTTEALVSAKPAISSLDKPPSASSAPSKTAKTSVSEKQKFLLQAQEKLAQVSKKQVSSAKQSIEVPLVAASVILPSEISSSLSNNQENLSDLTTQLQQQLVLPEHGSVTLTLKLDSQGHIQTYVIEAATSVRNRHYLEDNLPKLTFSSLSVQKELSVHLTLTSALPSS